MSIKNCKSLKKSFRRFFAKILSCKNLDLIKVLAIFDCMKSPYIVVRHIDPNLFIEAIKKNLADGYKFQGGISITSVKSKDGLLNDEGEMAILHAQAMVLQ